MTNTLKIFFRKYSQKNVQKPKSLFLMGTLEQCDSAVNNIKNLSNKDVIHAHRSFYPQFVTESLEAFQGEQFDDVRKRFEKFCYYNGQNRELYPSFTMMSAYKLFEKPERFTHENLRLISMLAWCFESLSTSAILTDDVMDNEESRWKNPCWYRQPNVGLTAIRDINMIRWSGIYMMRKYFAGHQHYESLFNLLYSMIQGMVVGQTIDMNLDEYIMACRYKCYEPIFRNCVLAVMHLLKRVEDFYPHDRVFELVSRHCQITNDLWDCFGRYESFGRGSTDIKEGKMTWAVIKALEHANEKQKVLLQENYAQDKPECEKIVMEVFREVDVVGKFYEYKAQLLEDLRSEAEKATVPEVSGLIQAFVDMYVDVNEDFSYN